MQEYVAAARGATNDAVDGAVVDFDDYCDDEAIENERERICWLADQELEERGELPSRPTPDPNSLALLVRRAP